MLPASTRTICPLCDSMAESVHNPAAASARYTCPRCGEYLIADDVLRKMGDDRHWKTTREFLSKGVRMASDQGKPLELKNETNLKRALAIIKPER